MLIITMSMNYWLLEISVSNNIYKKNRDEHNLATWLLEENKENSA